MSLCIKGRGKGKITPDPSRSVFPSISFILAVILLNIREPKEALLESRILAVSFFCPLV